MVLFDEWLAVLRLCGVFVCWTSRTTPVCHDCLVVNETSKFIINTFLHGTAARVLTSGHPSETKIKVLRMVTHPGP